ncbi:MAG: methyl-accepting chemotaxis protein [Gammaproteobacteria bacterium]|nr:methyl-accepting chemotaxis protein [Gammaproteobacteria bacterium]
MYAQRLPQTTFSRLPVPLLAGLSVSVLIMALIFSYTASQATNYIHYANLTKELQTLTLQMLRSSTDASKGKSSAFTFLQDAHDRFQQNLDLLQKGSSNLPPSPMEVQPSLQAMYVLWLEFSGQARQIQRSEGTIRLLNEFVTAVNDVIPGLNEHSEIAAQGLINKGAQKRQIYLASRQLMLGQRIATNINRLLSGVQFAEPSAMRLESDTREYGDVLLGLLSGNKQLGLEQVRDTGIRQELDQLLQIYEAIQVLVQRIMEKAPELFKIQQAQSDLASQSEAIAAHIGVIDGQYQTLQQQLGSMRLGGFAMGMVSMVFLAMLILRLNSGTKEQLLREEHKNRRVQNAILKLLDEIAPVAEGDLRAHATVSEEVTGAIADAINFTIEALRELVTTINLMAAEVESSADDTQLMALQLNRANDLQTQQIDQVNIHIHTIGDKIDQVTTSASDTVTIARQTMQSVEVGSQAVQETIKGMHIIVDDIRESSIRIKRLGETSQEIGDIVELINDIAEQTNILALNAAIKASNSGDGGVAFAGVADEVQQLADRVTQATGKIESLVRNIQQDTAKAVEAMEQSTGDVIYGAKLAETAGDALSQMQTVSAHLANFIHNVAQAATELRQLSQQTRESMEMIKQVTRQTQAGTRETARMAADLANKAAEQNRRLQAFTLPDDGNQDREGA